MNNGRMIKVHISAVLERKKKIFLLDSFSFFIQNLLKTMKKTFYSSPSFLDCHSIIILGRLKRVIVTS